MEMIAGRPIWKLRKEAQKGPLVIIMSPTGELVFNSFEDSVAPPQEMSLELGAHVARILANATSRPRPIPAPAPAKAEEKRQDEPGIPIPVSDENKDKWSSIIHVLSGALPPILDASKDDLDVWNRESERREFQELLKKAITSAGDAKVFQRMIEAAKSRVHPLLWAHAVVRRSKSEQLVSAENARQAKKAQKKDQ